MPRAVKRPYDSPRRRAQAGATRRAVLEAARALFLEQGYVATTIDAIAAAAAVSPETVYARFGNKRTLLARLVDVSIAGDDDALPILQQDWVQRMRDEPDVRRRLRILAGNGRAILERRAAVDEVVRGAAAADPEMAALRELGKAQRHAGQQELLRIVMGEAALRTGLDIDSAADVVYALGSPETWQLLVVDRAWTADRFERWYGDAIERLLLDPR
ncbi:MAG: TetR/AcrR family transcriptional regulator [Chloroflexi bacterium]|nr:TetR/AcrR family transcriptional regulator [Chloroflexota bacterium]